MREMDRLSRNASNSFKSLRYDRIVCVLQFLLVCQWVRNGSKSMLGFPLLSLVFASSTLTTETWRIMPLHATFCRSMIPLKLCDLLLTIEILGKAECLLTRCRTNLSSALRSIVVSTARNVDINVGISAHSLIALPAAGGHDCRCVGSRGNHA